MYKAKVLEGHLLPQSSAALAAPAFALAQTLDLGQGAVLGTQHFTTIRTAQHRFDLGHHLLDNLLVGIRRQRLLHLKPIL